MCRCLTVGTADLAAKSILLLQRISSADVCTGNLLLLQEPAGNADVVPTVDVTRSLGVEGDGGVTASCCTRTQVVGGAGPRPIVSHRTAGGVPGLQGNPCPSTAESMHNVVARFPPLVLTNCATAAIFKSFEFYICVLANMCNLNDNCSFLSVNLN